MNAALDHVTGLIRSRNLDQAAGALAKLIRKKGAADVDWRQASSLANTLGDQDLALAAAERWRDGNPDDPHRQIAVINALGAVARHKDAARLAHKLRENAGAGAEPYYLEANFQARYGRHEKALGLYRRALSVVPNHSPSWEQIALLGGFDDIEADIREMERLTGIISTPAHLVPLHYALGRAYDMTGNYDSAFSHIQAGARLRERLSPFNVQPQCDYYGRLQGGFTRERIERLGSDGGGKGAVFIISAPRSGTTLVEQILSTSGDLTPTGEHTFIRLATLPLVSMEAPDLARAEQFDSRSWKQMAQVYLKGVHRRFGIRGGFTDKSLLNHNFAGIIRILFPEARFIWLRRDPRDVAWSCFRSRINANQWAQRMDDCMRYLDAHEALCVHWRAVLGDSLLAVSYEDLVTSPESTTAALFDHAGLARPDDWQEFYKASNPVATASIAQVRNPLSRSALGSWLRYKKHLAPVYKDWAAETSRG